MRKTLALIVGVVVLVAANVVIYQREQLLVDGRIVLLELAPVDPRSLMQGDYMALRFAVANAAFRGRDGRLLTDGHVVLDVDPQGVATFSHLDQGTELAAGDIRMRYRVRNEQVKFATNAFFFEEGQAQRYERARYGEFRVAQNGEALLTGLRDAELRDLSQR